MFNGDLWILRLERWSDIIISFGDRYQDALEKYSLPWQDYFNKLSKSIQGTLKGIGSLLMEFYFIARVITFPLHWIWIWAWEYSIRNSDEKEPLNQIGVHYVTALAGQGKSTLLWQKMYDYEKITGKCSYVTTEMEKIKFDEFGDPYVKHIHFRITDFFGHNDQDSKFGIQKKRFNKELACAVVYDELHVLNNNRLNGTRENKQVFIPMINSFVTQRHHGINWILLASQQPKNDSQIMNIITGYHRVTVRKGFSYSKWLNDGKFQFVIKGWKIKSYTVRAENDYLKLIGDRSWFKHATVDFSDFETLNMSKALDNLPMDRKELL